MADLTPDQITKLAGLVDNRIQENLSEIVGRCMEDIEKRVMEILEGQAAFHMAEQLAEKFDAQFAKAYEGFVLMEAQRIQDRQHKELLEQAAAETPEGQTITVIQEYPGDLDANGEIVSSDLTPAAKPAVKPTVVPLGSFHGDGGMGDDDATTEP